jgi:hypothetical protein
VSEYYSVRETCEGDEQYRINITVDKQSLSMAEGQRLAEDLQESLDQLTQKHRNTETQRQTNLGPEAGSWSLLVAPRRLSSRYASAAAIPFQVREDFGRCGDTTRVGLVSLSAQTSRAPGVTKPSVVWRVSLRHLLCESLLHLLWLCVLTMLAGP